MTIPAASGTVISFPVPPYANVPIEEDFYIPQRHEITDVTLGVTTTVTMIESHSYVIGQECRLNIPLTFGCRQLNQQTGYVISIPAVNQVELTIDSSKNVDPFIASTATTRPQIIPVGDVNLGPINANGRRDNITYIPGSFRNISPI